MIAGALVLPPTILGMIEQSATRSPSTPRTRSAGSTTARSSSPILQVPTGWKIVAPKRRTNAASSSSVRTSSPGSTSRGRYFSKTSAWLIRLASLSPLTSTRKSSSSEKNCGSMTGGASGSAEARETVPRLFGRSSTACPE